MELGVKERDRISLLRQAHDGLVTVSEAAARAEVTTRHLRRLLRRFEAEGDAVAVHGLRGRRSNRALPREVRERALAVAADPMYRDFGPTLLAEHLELRCGLRVSADTLRRWMLDAGLWERARKRAKHRSRRPRRAALGELAQWDSSVHPWLEDRAEGSQALISIHDDATSRLMFARFVERDNGAENRRAMMAYLRRHGRPLAAYADHAGHFGQWQSRTGRRTDTIIARALDALGIELILAGSPQAKGRVERAFGTAQDRLVKEMRVAGIDTLDAANRHLEAEWIPFWNARFAVEPREALDAHRRLPPGVDLQRLFAETADRVVARDFTIRFANRHWQIPEGEARGLRPGTRVVVERRLDGELRFRTGERYLAVLPTPSPAKRARRRPPEPRKPSKVQSLEPPIPRPGRDDHCWVTRRVGSDQIVASGAGHPNGRPGKRGGRVPARTGAVPGASR